MKWFNNLSILKKHLLIFGPMALAMLVLAGAFVFNSYLLSGLRVYIHGESLFAKAQKDAVISLRQYVISSEESGYRNFLGHIDVLLGDRDARLELEKESPDYDKAYSGFIRGRNHPEDIPTIISFFRNFEGISYFRDAVAIWRESDRLVDALVALGQEALETDIDRQNFLRELDSINEEFTDLEERFSATLSRAAREVSNFLNTLFSFGSSLVVVLGVWLSLVLSFSVSNRLGEMIVSTRHIAQGDFKVSLALDSKDELGELAVSINDMADKIGSYISELDLRKQELAEKAKNLKVTNTAVLNLVEDIEASRKRLEEESERSNAIISSMGEGILVTNAYGIVVKVNQAAANILGRQPKEIVGNHLVKVALVYDKDHKEIPTKDRPVTESLITGRKVSETVFFMKDDNYVPVLVTVTPIIYGGKPIGAVEILRDVTLEAKVDRVKTEFVSIASHQLRTPLSTIGWYAEMLLSGDAGSISPAQKDYLTEIYKGNKRMIELINALLNVSRLEVGEFFVESSEVSVRGAVSEVVLELKKQFAGKNIKFEDSYSDNLPLLFADKGLLKMILQNLLSNAFKYTPNGGKVSFGATLEKLDSGEGMLLKISDNGIGIPQSQQGKIFQKLFRADNAREKDPEGNGLGLYIVKSIIEQTGGKIWFESEEGQGTTFSVLVPVRWMELRHGTKSLV